MITNPYRIKSIGFVSVLLIIAFFFTLNGKALSSDVTPPELIKVEAENMILNEGDSFRVYVFAKDDTGIYTETILSEVCLARETASGEERKYKEIKLNDTEEDGKYYAEFIINDTWTAGKYNIEFVILNDLNNNRKVYYRKDTQNNISNAVFYIGVIPDEPTPAETDEPTPAEPDEPAPTVPEEPTSAEPEEPTPSEPDSEKNPYEGLPDGLNKVDNEWVYIKDEKLVSDFSGLKKHDNEYWYIQYGKANFEYTGLVTSSPIEGYNEIRWYWVTNGVFDKTHTAAEPYLDRGIYLVENGYIDFHKTTVFYNDKSGQWMVFIDGLFSKNANGIYQNKYGWWKATNGIVNFKENGVFQNSFGWWRVKDSKVDFNAQGIYQNSFGWWKTTNGKVTFNENGVFQNEFGWWKVKDSKVDFSFTGIASNKFGSWYIKGGKVDFSKNGKVYYNNKTYTIKNGKVV